MHLMIGMPRGFTLELVTEINAILHLHIFTWVFSSFGTDPKGLIGFEFIKVHLLSQYQFDLCIIWILDVIKSLFRAKALL